MRLTTEQKEMRLKFSKMTYLDFKRQLKTQVAGDIKRAVTNPVDVMLAASLYKRNGLMTVNAYNRFTDGALKELNNLKRE